MLIATDARLPRNKANMPLWVTTLEISLAAHEDEGATTQPGGILAVGTP
jgi:hypothetical protein